MVSEIKRGSNGAIEVKLINRIAILELLTQLLNSSGDQSKEAESFFCAMDKAAARLCEAEQ